MNRLSKRIIALILGGVLLSSTLPTNTLAVPRESDVTTPIIASAEETSDGELHQDVVASVAGDSEKNTEKTEDNDENLYYILGRPMTAEESEEQLSHINRVPVDLEEDLIPDFQFTDEPEYLIEDTLPAKYDLRDEKLVTDVRNQNPYGTCWVHGSIGSFESNILKRFGVSKDLSESHLFYHSYYVEKGEDPLGNCDNDSLTLSPYTRKQLLNKGGNQIRASHTLSNWKGSVEESLYPYKNVETQTFTKKPHEENEYILDELIVESMANENAVKSLLMQYGAFSTNYCDDDPFLNTSAAAYYCPTKYKINHAITVVGWDDNFSRNNFNNIPSRDGAWIIKNSWGTWFGEQGYMYISYEDGAFKNEGTKNSDGTYTNPASDAYFFTGRKQDSSMNNYHYDGGNFPYYAFVAPAIAQAYKTCGNNGGTESINGFGLFVNNANVDYKLDLYMTNKSDISSVTNPLNGTSMLKKSITGKFEHVGYNRVEIAKSDFKDAYQTIDEGKVFTIVLTFPGVRPSILLDASVSGAPDTNLDNSNKGENFYGYSATSFSDMSEMASYEIMTPWMNVFTTDEGAGSGPVVDDEADSIELDYGLIALKKGETKQLTYKLKPSTAKSANVSFSSQCDNIATVDSTGLITAKGKGATYIIAVHKGIEYKCEVEVYEEKEPATPCTVTFDLNGGTFKDDTKTTVVVSKGDIIEKPSNPTKPGYKFIGWDTVKESPYELKNEFDFNEGIDADITLYAKWERSVYSKLLVDQQIVTINKDEEVDVEAFLLCDDTSYWDETVIKLRLSDAEEPKADRIAEISAYSYDKTTGRAIAKVKGFKAGTVFVIAELFNNSGDVSVSNVLKEDINLSAIPDVKANNNALKAAYMAITIIDDKAPDEKEDKLTPAKDSKTETISTIGAKQKVTITVPNLNLFYKTAKSKLNVKSNSAYDITKLELSEDLAKAFLLTKESDGYYLSTKNKSETYDKQYIDYIKVYFAGYSDPVEVKVTIKTETKVPKLNMANNITLEKMDKNKAVVILKEGKNFFDITGSKLEIINDSGFIKCESLGSALAVSLLDYAPNNKQQFVNVRLTNDAWNDGIPVAIKANVKTGAVKLNVKPSNVTLTTFAEKPEAYIELIPDRQNLPIQESKEWRVELYDTGLKKYVENTIFDVDYEAGFISVGLKKGKNVAAGNYKLKISNVFANTKYSSVYKEFTVKVDSKKPTANIKLTGSIDLTNRTKTLITGKITLKNVVGTVSSVKLLSDNYYAYMTCDNTFEIKLKNDAEAVENTALSTKKQIEIPTSITLTDGTVINDVKIKIKPKQTLPKVKTDNLVISKSEKNDKTVKIDLQSFMPSGMVIDTVDDSTSKVPAGLIIDKISKKGERGGIILKLEDEDMKNGKYNLVVNCFLDGQEEMLLEKNKKPATITIPIVVTD